MSKPTLVIEDKLMDFNKIIKSFKNDAVLVGIPESKTPRKENDAPINNAALLAINEFGSEVNHIPPRPVMAIGIRKAQDEIAEQFKLAVINSFKQGEGALNTYYNRAGIIASVSVKKTINQQDVIKKPSDATIAARKAMGFKGEKALIVTGQMRNSITYVVKGKG